MFESHLKKALNALYTVDRLRHETGILNTLLEQDDRGVVDREEKTTIKDLLDFLVKVPYMDCDLHNQVQKIAYKRK